MTIELLEFEKILSGKRILVTGHTGFTGSWLCLWLQSIGADIFGFSLAPHTNPSLYLELELDKALDSQYGDICDFKAINHYIEKSKPELIIHLAAQPLVRYSYTAPIETFAVNALGTAHVLEAARLSPTVKAILCITTDKVYQNNDWPWPYRENDRLGGKDPYSASKAAAEIIIGSYRDSFSLSESFSIAVARGGNIIGGGDWALDRLIPDFVRASQTNGKLTLRYPHATRPWQHVLGLIQGYLMLLAALIDKPSQYATAWNFGPSDLQHYTVRDVLNLLCKHWTTPHIEYMDNPLHESNMLSLDSSLAREKLGWKTPWDTQKVIIETANWYREYYEGKTAKDLCHAQIESWRNALKAQI